MPGAQNTIDWQQLMSTAVERRPQGTRTLARVSALKSTTHGSKVALENSSTVETESASYVYVRIRSD